MSSKGLEILEQNIRQAIGLARHRLYRRRVRVVAGSNKGRAGVVQSVQIGDQGQLLAAIMVDNHAIRRGVRRPRLILPIGILDIGDEEPLT